MSTAALLLDEPAAQRDFAPAAVTLRSRCRDYERMAAVLDWLGEHYHEQPSLAEAAERAGLSRHHFQRTFSRWVGVSPKKYVQYLTLQRAKEALDQSASVLDAAYASGLSGPGRLHDLFVAIDALTPGEYKQRGAGMVVHYGEHDSPYGRCLLMHTERGICGLAFVDTGRREAAFTATFAELAAGFENADFREDLAGGARLAARIFGPRGGAGEPIPLLLAGTPFQIKVWEALLAIPAGTVSTYGDLARRIGAPGAARAVGSAGGANPVSYLIPCHRVIRKSGALGGYRWGLGRKLAMLTEETAALPAAG